MHYISLKIFLVEIEDICWTHNFMIMLHFYMLELHVTLILIQWVQNNFIIRLFKLLSSNVKGMLKGCCSTASYCVVKGSGYVLGTLTSQCMSNHARCIEK